MRGIVDTARNGAVLKTLSDNNQARLRITSLALGGLGGCLCLTACSQAKLWVNKRSRPISAARLPKPQQRTFIGHHGMSASCQKRHTHRADNIAAICRAESVHS
jgi:hypothetical protein